MMIGVESKTTRRTTRTTATIKPSRKARNLSYYLVDASPIVL
jgi:hypothetical protein